MTELLRVALRAIGVVLPGAAVLGLVVLRGGGDPEDFGPFLGAMGLSLLAAAVWSAIDAGRAPVIRVLIRWVAIAFVVGCGLALAQTVLAPGSPPGAARVAEAGETLQFFGVWLLAAAGLGLAMGALRDQPRRHKDPALRKVR